MTLSALSRLFTRAPASEPAGAGSPAATHEDVPPEFQRLRADVFADLATRKMYVADPAQRVLVNRTLAAPHISDLSERAVQALVRRALGPELDAVFVGVHNATGSTRALNILVADAQIGGGPIAWRLSDTPQAPAKPIDVAASVRAHLGTAVWEGSSAVIRVPLEPTMRPPDAAELSKALGLPHGSLTMRVVEDAGTPSRLVVVIDAHAALAHEQLGASAGAKLFRRIDIVAAFHDGLRDRARLTDDGAIEVRLPTCDADEARLLAQREVASDVAVGVRIDGEEAAVRLSAGVSAPRPTWVDRQRATMLRLAWDELSTADAALDRALQDAPSGQSVVVDVEATQAKRVPRGLALLKEALARTASLHGRTVMDVVPHGQHLVRVTCTVPTTPSQPATRLGDLLARR